MSTFMNDRKIHILFGILFFLAFIYYYFKLDQVKTYVVELFENYNKNIWSEDLKKRFLAYHKTMYDGSYRYDMEILQQQVTPEEVEEYLKTGYWKWDEELKKLYLEKIESSTIIQSVPAQSLNDAMKIYNAEAMKKILAWNYKEGEFVLYGAKDVNGNVVRCSNDSEPTLMNKNKEKLENENISTSIPGFSFIEDPCNPCDNLNLSNANCKFKLNVDGNDETSLIWKRIWNL